MTLDIVQSKDKAPKVKRTIALEAHINEKLENVCKHLGVSVHSYLVAKIGESVSRDSIQFQLGGVMDSQGEFLKNLTDMLNIEKSIED